MPFSIFAQGTWQSKAPLPAPRTEVAVAELKIYVAGGRQGSLASNRRTLEVYDPATNAWKPLPDMPTARGSLAAAALAGRLYVFGGEATFGTFSQNEEFDPVAEIWRSLRPMPAARHGLGAVSFNGKIYVIGGGPQPGLFVSDANEVFTPPTTAVAESPATIKDFRLQNYPNPWKRSAAMPHMAMRYNLPQAASVRLTIYNALGQRVRTLINGNNQAAGEHIMNWNGLDDAGQSVKSGVYFFRVETGRHVAGAKLMMLE